jgi:DNA polymerase bacteriophage-type
MGVSVLGQSERSSMTDIAHLDLETASTVDLPKCGTHRYGEEARALLAAWSINDGPVQLWDVTDGSPMPRELESCLLDPKIIKHAWNAQFERTIIKAVWGIECPPESWRCVMVQAMANGLPGALGQCAHVLGLAEQKDPIGKKLIKMFSLPQKPTKKQPKVWLNHTDRPAEWDQFKAYCIKDVEVERAIHHTLRDLPRKEWELWALDQRANDTGLCVDRRLVECAIRIDDQQTAKLLAEAEQITGLDNPNSVAQLKAWLLAEHGEEVESLNKASVADLTVKLNGDAQRMLEIRQQLGKTSIDKYRAIDRSVCADGRVRGLLQFYGASRTGRWAGRLVQVQNLPRPSVEDWEQLELARDLVKMGDGDLLQMIYGNPAQVLADLIRTAITAAEGKRLIVCDESAIEARVLAWLAGEEWRLEVFRTHGKIYEASASQMFKVPLDKIKKGNPEYALRQRGKVAELALGYQGGPGALITMGALKMGIPEDELQGLVDAWRASNRKVMALWYQIEGDAKRCIRERIPVNRDKYGFTMDGKTLLMHLPNGRALAYWNTRIQDSQIKFDGMDQKTKRWTTLDTYGGKLVENLTQAVARDCMAEAMLRMRDAGYQIRMTVHDEVVAEVPNGTGSVEEVEALMGEPIAWADGLPLNGAGFESFVYRKD